MSPFFRNERTGKIIEEPPYPCKMCGMWEIPHSHEICGICGWQDNIVQNNNPDYEGGANKLSFNQHKSIWTKHKQVIMNKTSGKGRFVKELFDKLQS